ncbi:MAG TPA: alpha/beta hydrolase, partial [Gammaproteobacteria bacterium]|nr:alpha/beta hydrolase [Gammaproteobacteria bacterium]
SGRRIDFDLKNTLAAQAVYFCERRGEGDYLELGSVNFMSRLKEAAAEQILIYLHGFSNLPEKHIFPDVQRLQALFDYAQPGLVEVVPLIWPCDDDFGIIKDYWDDQKAADASAYAFSRVMEKFLGWRGRPENEMAPCLKRINILAHSMGNRVLRETLNVWGRYDRGGVVPLLFRNVFMVAADIVNESLQRGGHGAYITMSARNVAVYYASDDLALRASKVSNLKNKVASRRLGHTGPEDMRTVPRNVYAIDCDEVNTKYDSLVGHTYFYTDESGRAPGVVFQHIFDAVRSGRVNVDDPDRRTHILR